MPDLDPATLAELTADLVAAYVTRNHVGAAELPDLIQAVHGSLSGLGSASEPAPAVTLTPAVPIRKSVTDEFIVSLEDGRKFKSLKRYLATSHGMTPADYRAKWGLPADYPMVAPAYAAQRSELAKSRGLGRKPVDAPLPEPDEVLEPAKVPEMRKPGRPKRGA